MRITVDRGFARGVTLVTLAGELDLACASLLRRTLLRLPSTVLPEVVTDLHEVDFMDCSAVGVFVLAHRRAATVGGRLHIAEAAPQPRRLLDMARLDSVFCLHETLEASVAVHEPSGWSTW